MRDPHRPAGFDAAGVTHKRMRRLGGDELFLVAADVNATQLSALQDTQGVFVFPQNLDNTMTVPQRNQARNALEARNLPGDWIGAQTTWRQVARFIYALSMFAGPMMQRRRRKLFRGGYTLDTRWGELPAQLKEDILDTIQAKGYDATGITDNTLLRTVLTRIAQRDAATPFSLSPVTV